MHRLSLIGADVPGWGCVPDKISRLQRVGVADGEAYDTTSMHQIRQVGADAPCSEDGDGPLGESRGVPAGAAPLCGEVSATSKYPHETWSLTMEIQNPIRPRPPSLVYRHTARTGRRDHKCRHGGGPAWPHGVQQAGSVDKWGGHFAKVDAHAVEVPGSAGAFASLRRRAGRRLRAEPSSADDVDASVLVRHRCLEPVLLEVAPIVEYE